jgi:hypothetical protein
LIFAGSPPQLLDGIAHGGQIDYGRNAGEVLHQHPSRVVGDFHRSAIGFLPAGDIEQVFLPHDAAIEFSQQVFNQNADGKRQPVDVRHVVFLQLPDIRNAVLPTVNGDPSHKIISFHRHSSLVRRVARGPFAPPRCMNVRAFLIFALNAHSP